MKIDIMVSRSMPTPDYSVDLDLGEPPPALQEYARQHCGEDPNTRLQAIYELRDIIYGKLLLSTSPDSKIL